MRDGGKVIGRLRIKSLKVVVPPPTYLEIEKVRGKVLECGDGVIIAGHKFFQVIITDSSGKSTSYSF